MSEDPWSVARARDTTTCAQHARSESYPRDPTAVERGHEDETHNRDAAHPCATQQVPREPKHTFMRTIQSRGGSSGS